MSVQFIDFSKQNEAIKPEVDAGWQAVIAKSAFIMGPQVKAFEEEFARYCGVKYAIGVNSGTDALYLALAALDIKPGDEVQQGALSRTRRANKGRELARIDLLVADSLRDADLTPELRSALEVRRAAAPATAGARCGVPLRAC